MTDIPEKIDRICWVDLEMTGLDTSRHVIVEVAALITDGNLNIIGDGLDMVVHATEAELAEMDEFVTNMHSENGLLAQIKESTHSIQDAEQAVLDLLAEHTAPHHPVPLAGNSIATDRGFIREYMPKLDAALHYRMIDVSTIKELTRRWFPRAYYCKPEKGLAHRALADIVESIEELDYYRRAVFTQDPGPSREDATSAAKAAKSRYQAFL